jgi:energy-converting hydrogenase B subunit D
VTVLQVTVFALVALGAPTVVLVRDLLRMAVVNGLYGLVLSLLFVALGAPDVALWMIVVSSVAYPTVLLIAIARSRSSKEEMEDS